MRSNSEFLLTDTSQSLDLAGRQSIVAYDLRTVVCIPLRKMQVQATRDAQTPAPARVPPRPWECCTSIHASLRAISAESARTFCT